MLLITDFSTTLKMFGMPFCLEIVNQNNFIFLIITHVYFYFIKKVDPAYLENDLCMQVC